ncbi:MAG: 4-hydroxythreonine-4-phosphate dehydrogenase, partial [Methylobacteriaceae bacterium]|nr:4-hydroxythreonine-4-phosphate dehydrogenase [Methylobacteriaceae bacterium]
MSSSRPVLAHAIGCPAGIAPELSARMLADPGLAEAARIVAIGDARILDYGARVAGVRPAVTQIGE